MGVNRSPSILRWWGRLRLRTRIFLAFSALVVASLYATLGFTQFVVSRDAVRTLHRELTTTGEVFDRLLAQRAVRLEMGSTLLVSDFALKALIASHFDPEEYDAQTLASAADNWRRRLAADLLWVTDENGALLVTSQGPDAARRSIAALPPLREALSAGEVAAAIGAVDGALYQLTAVPVFAPDVIGYLLVGALIDDNLAAGLKQATGSDVSFLNASAVYASSWPAPARTAALPAPEQYARLVGDHSGQPVLLEARNGRHLTLAVPIDAAVAPPVFALMQASYDEALAPLRSLQRRILVIGAVALLAALLIGMRLADGITAPVRSLVAGMREVVRGNLQFRSGIEREDEIGFLARSFNDMVAGLEERERIRDTFGRFVSRDVAEAVLGGRVPLEGARREASILFQDIRGFTALSERLGPEALLDVLNQFFTEVVAAVEAEGGVVKQFLGDGVMALFGAPQPYADHAQRAVRAALGIVQRLHELNERLAQRGMAPLAIGVGVHTGEVVAGLIGPDNRSEYGVVGDAVNVASRIESLTREVGATVLVSRDIASRLGDEFVLGRTAALQVKGKRQPVEVVEVLSTAGSQERLGADASLTSH
jgi:class 3 adenylate cyclase